MFRHQYCVPSPDTSSRACQVHATLAAPKEVFFQTNNQQVELLNLFRHVTVTYTSHVLSVYSTNWACPYIMLACGTLPCILRCWRAVVIT